HVELLNIGIVRDVPLRFLHALGNAAPESDDFYLLDRLALGVGRLHGDRRRPARLGDVAVEIGMADAAAGSGSRDPSEANAKSVGALAPGGGCQRLPAGRAGRDGGLWTLRPR